MTGALKRGAVAQIQLNVIEDNDWAAAYLTKSLLSPTSSKTHHKNSSRGILQKRTTRLQMSQRLRLKTESINVAEFVPR